MLKNLGFAINRTIANRLLYTTTNQDAKKLPTMKSGAANRETTVKWDDRTGGTYKTVVVTDTPK